MKQGHVQGDTVAGAHGVLWEITDGVFEDSRIKCPSFFGGITCL